MPRFISVDFDPFAESREIEKITLTNEPQREIWLSCIIGGDDANLSYNESVSLKLKGDVNFIALKKAVNNLVLRHEALRSTISPNGEVLIIYKDCPIDFSLNDISFYDEVERNAEFAAFLKKEMATPLDIQDGPLFRVFLHRTEAQEYYFTIIKHHIIGDGWSTGIMLEDLSKMYNAYVDGNEVVLESPFQLSDYAAAQAAFKGSKAYKETEDYWVDLYKDGVPVVDLPVDHQRFAPRSYKGHRSDHALSKEMVDQLKKVGAKAGASLVTTLLSAFEVFLYKVTQQTDIVVGLPASGQAATGLNSVVGHCVNLLPLISHIDPSASFKDYLKKRKKEVLDAYDHQRLTFGELIKKLYIPRDASRIALVPVIFNIDMGMDNSVVFNGLDFKLISNPRDYENFELYLNATGSKDGIILEWSYNTDLFEPSTIDKFNEVYSGILQSIISSVDETVASIVGVVHQVVPAIQGNALSIPTGTTINTLITDSVKANSQSIAISFKGMSLTYQQLSDKVDQMVVFLTQRGVVKGDIIAISLDRSVEMLVCLLAVLKSGGVYLPLDPEYPVERIGFMLKDSSAKLLLTSEKYKNKNEFSVKEIIIEQIWSGLTAPEHLVSSQNVAEQDLAYILYTSGSTGMPKGVCVTHGNLANLLLSMRVTPGINSNDKLLAITSISFDIAGLELYLPLITGAEIVLADTDATRDGRLLVNMLNEKNISIIQATPSSLQMMSDAGWEKYSSIKVLSGGEALPKELAKKLLSVCDQLWNMYGPTETTIWSTVKQIYSHDKQITIGAPIHNTRVYIMNEQGKPVAQGQPGEICIGGDGVAKGYYNRPELTAEKFVPDTFSSIVGARLYKTGDLGKIADNGEIFCLGRIDYQVKIRGHRIELGEIENLISKQQGVKQAVVVAQEANHLDKRLVAYLTLDNDINNSKDPSWKDRWDTLYTIGAEDKQKEVQNDKSIDGTLLDQLENSEVLNAQLSEWLETSVDRIKQINAKQIYEIGSGAGQILFELAPGIEYYMATDYSGPAIDNINLKLKASPQKWSHVKTSVASADDFSAIEGTSVDLVLINSVAQYFPNADYLISVIRQAIAAITKGGCIFIGDMQGMKSLEMYHAMDFLPRAADHTTVSSFKDIVNNRVRIEEEFVADPVFFYLLQGLFPQITGVDVQLRKGQSLNETTKYHYDVWLYIGTPITIVSPDLNYEWNELITLEKLENELIANPDSVVSVKNVFNSRTSKDFRLQQLLHDSQPEMVIGDLRNIVLQEIAGEHPDNFWLLGEKLKYNTHIRWTTDGTDNRFDVMFIPASTQLVLPFYAINEQINKSIYDYTRAPISQNEIQIQTEVVQLWKEKLKEVLPVYMVPDDFVVLKKFPLTPNAKIDRKALPKPQTKQQESVGQVALTANEKIVADIWSATLGIDNLKPTDDFFQLGGHSLLAVKVMVAIEKKTGKRLPIATLFNHSSIQKLASQLSDNAPVKKWDVLVPIKTTGSRVPLFLIHGGGLNILLFKSISEYFDEDQPVYGIQALGLNHETNIPSTIESIAKRYVDEIVELYPEGPYAIAGYSLGGFMAFEMARQLKQMGKELKFVGIMDTYAGNNLDEGGVLSRSVKKVARQFRKIPFFTKSFIVNPKETYEYQKIVTQRRLEKIASSGTVIPKDTFTEYEAGIYRKYSDALDVFLLTPLDIEITLFRVEKRLYFLDDLVYLGWGKFALKGVKIEPVPGDHKTFLYPPNSQRFAQILQRSLNEKHKRVN